MNDIKMTAQVHEVLEEKTIGQDNLRLKDVIVMYQSGEYQHALCITLWGDSCDWNLTPGTIYDFWLKLSSREGREGGQWFTNVKAWKYKEIEPAATGTPVETVEETGEADLPF